MPIGNKRTCLPDALHVGMIMMDVRPSLQLQQSVTRSALVSKASDPTFTMAKLYAAQHGIDLKYDRTLNCPQRLFDRRQGTFLVQLQISTLAGVDYHYVAPTALKLPSREPSREHRRPCNIDATGEVWISLV